MSVTESFAIATALMGVLMSVLYALHRRLKNAGVVDVGWAAGLALVALFYAVSGSGYAPRRWLIGAMAVFWGVRLAWHLWTDRVSGKPEEGRYQTLRAEWGASADKKFFFFFQFQALLDVYLSIPFWLIAQNTAPAISALEWGAAALWALALAMEASADHTLRRYKADPAHHGKTCRQGLWRYSRHPNYFAEWVMWVAYALMAWPAPHGWIAWLAPATILFFLLRVTGIPATEAQAVKTRGEDYRDYQRTTSRFVPWFANPLAVYPDWLIRWGIRRLLAQRLREEDRGSEEANQQHFHQLLDTLRSGPIAVETQAANEQHYEVPTAFYETVLGNRLKYSSGYWKPGTVTLDQAEEDMVALTIERAELANGQDILELGCGWGSLTLTMAQRFPQSRIVAVSNSRTQRVFIEKRMRDLGLANVQVITMDINHFDIARRFDRIVSVEMFEHLRNHAALFERLDGWLKPGGKCFVHIFTHKTLTYLFEPSPTPDPGDWMARYFFTGGMMPSDSYLLYVKGRLDIDRHWRVDGTHYQKTAEAWLARMDASRKTLWPLFEETYGAEQAERWWAYWRVFFMACAELWGYRGGREWLVSHYRFVKPQPSGGAV